MNTRQNGDVLYFEANSATTAGESARNVLQPTARKIG